MNQETDGLIKMAQANRPKGITPRPRPKIPKGRKAIKQALTQLNLQQLAQENPAIMKSFVTIIMVLEGLGSSEFETDMAMQGNEYHFQITKTKKASGITDLSGEVIA